jgi:hypothetical protein
MASARCPAGQTIMPLHLPQRLCAQPIAARTPKPADMNEKRSPCFGRDWTDAVISRGEILQRSSIPAVLRCAILSVGRTGDALGVLAITDEVIE